MTSFSSPPSSQWNKAIPTFRGILPKDLAKRSIAEKRSLVLRFELRAIVKSGRLSGCSFQILFREHVTILAHPQ